MPPKRTVLNSAGISPSRIPVGLALSRLPLLLALILFGTGSGAAAGAPHRSDAAPTVDYDGSAVDRLATAFGIDADGRPLDSPRADEPCESEPSDEGGADADGVTSGFEASDVQPSRPLHAEAGTPVCLRSRTCCSPRAPPRFPLLASRQ